MNILYRVIKRLITDVYVNEKVAVFLTASFVFLLILGVSVLIYYVLKKVILRMLGHLVKKTKNKWDNILYRHKVFNSAFHIIPALFISLVSGFANKDIPWLQGFLKETANIYIIAVILVLLNRFLNAFQDIYSELSFAAERPIKGYVQALKIIILLIGAIFIISVITDYNPGDLFTGLGAMAAVLMFVFKDAILGFVASIQIVANNMIKQNDWISMPKYNADGTVEDISLTTVKVQNWDKTITTIPTYALVSESVTNWVGMEKSGGRRIKRSINIDVGSVKFCDEKMLKRLSKFAIIKDYIADKEREISEHNKKLNYGSEEVLFGRRQTNIGIFRKYLESYLHAHPKVHDGMTFLVRHLRPTEKGLPVEIYVFSNEQEWGAYEAVQADIFDHIIAVMHQFELRIFQSPSGDDIRKAVERISI